jgi:acyl-CoA thioesterase
MDSKEKAWKIAKEQMFDNDAFSQWLGIEPVELDAGKAVLSLTIRKEMTNGFGIAHGGISYSLADSALAFAANAHGRQSLSIETSISHTKPVKLGDKIIATATERSLTKSIAIYSIDILNQHGDNVALFKGTVYRTSKDWAL